MNRQLAFDAVVALVVATVIGLLAHPFVQGQLQRARQAEAKNNLILIHTLESSYYQARGVYHAFKDLSSQNCADAELGFKIAGCERARYGYSASVTSAKGDKPAGFTAYAKAPAGAIVPGCKVEDTWTVNERRQLSALKGRDSVQSCIR